MDIQQRFITVISKSGADVIPDPTNSKDGPVQFRGLSSEVAAKLMVGPPAVSPSYVDTGPSMYYMFVQAKKCNGLLDGVAIPPTANKRGGMIMFNGIHLKNEVDARNMAEFFPPSQMTRSSDGTWHLQW